MMGDKALLKSCPKLTGYEVRPALMVGHGDVTVPVLHVCITTQCSAYDEENDKCLMFNNSVRYEEEQDEAR